MSINHTPEDILMMARQFMESRILLTAAELNLFTLLDEKPSTARQLAGRMQADLRGLVILLDALAAMGLVVKQPDEIYRIDPDAASCLSDRSARSVLPMVHHANHLWKSWSNLTSRVKATETAELFPSDVRSETEMRAFIGAMHVVGGPLADKIAAAVKSGGAKNLLDVGGASGTYTIAFLKTSPAMKATLFDRPPVIAIARERVAEAGMTDRVHFAEGDFYKDEFPGGHDLALISAIIHQNSPVQNVELFQKTRRAMVSGGRIIIRDHIMEPNRIEPKDGALFAVNMLVNTHGGSTFTFDEIKTWLEEAGFVDVRLLQTGARMDGLVEAVVP